MKKSLFAFFTVSILSLQTIYSQDCVDVCPAIGVSTQFEWIQGVSIGPLFNISGNNDGYEDFGAVNATFTAGTTYSYEIAVGYADGPFSETFSAWMDFNQDGDFEDLGEEIFTDFGQFRVSGSFSVPLDAVNGNIKLRITMGFAQANLCEDVLSGEIEDYCVTIAGGVSSDCDSSLPVTGLQSVTTGNVITLNWDPVTNSVGCRISGGQNGNFNIFRNIVGTEPSSFSFPSNALEPGIYNWKVACGCSQTPPFDLTPDSGVEFFEILPLPAPNFNLVEESVFGEFTLSPNPTVGNVDLRISAASNSLGTVIINNMLGSTVLQRDVYIAQGSNDLNVDVSELPRGIYSLSIINNKNNDVNTIKFIKK